LTAIPTDIATAMQGVDMMDTPTTEQVISHSVSRDTAPPPAKFTLSAPPGPRNGRDNNKGVNQNQLASPQQSSANLGVVSRTPGAEHGVPPLTPLREMMERAEDTSDEASSIAPSEKQSVSDYGHSPSVSASSLANNAVREPPRTARPHAASVPRSSPPRDSRNKKHTPGSGSGSSSSSHKLKPVRTSEEDVPKSPSHQDFETLIRSDQTIQYTLTPQNMRNIEVS